MNRRFFCACLVVIMAVVIPLQCIAAEGPSFCFDLAANGENSIEVSTGDVITVTLKLRRIDDTVPYTMYAMQDEIRYDRSFLELVPGSEILNTGIVLNDIAVTDQYREVYMNYLSMSGGTEWDSEVLVGTIQFRVVGTSGVTHITNQDYLVSFQDGTGFYDSSANDVTVILSTECLVTFHSNGGSEVPEQTVQYGEKIIAPEDPVREGYRLTGWFTDIDRTNLWDFENNVVRGNMSLYAGWERVETEPTTEPVQSPEDTGSGCCLWWLWLLLLILLLLIIYWILKKKKEDESKPEEENLTADGETKKEDLS